MEFTQVAVAAIATSAVIYAVALLFLKRRSPREQLSLDEAIDRALTYEVFESDAGPGAGRQIRQQIAEGRFASRAPARDRAEMTRVALRRGMF